LSFRTYVTRAEAPLPKVWHGGCGRWPAEDSAVGKFLHLIDDQIIHEGRRRHDGLRLDILLGASYHSPRMSTRNLADRSELLQGTLDLLILRTLLFGPSHGHAIAKTIERNSEDVLQVEQGSLYPALHRLIKRGWISVSNGTSENNRRAKFYRLTAKGRRQLLVETNKWDRLAGAIARILRPAGEGH
jgi:PadR family transcriptional regulator, regulatory protein PadR